jgi:hypothetical protein
LGLFFLFFLILVIISIIWSSFSLGISPMPTSRKVRKALPFLLPPSIEGRVAEVGSGFGHLAIFLSKRLPQCQILAYELSFVPFIFSLFWKKLFRRKNLYIQRKDFFDISFKEFHLVTCYLFPKGMERLKEKLKNELPEGAYVLSHTFAFRGWEPIRIFEVKDLGRTRIYLYRI